MKLFIIATLIVFCSASTLYRGKNVSVKEDGTVVITNESGKKVIIHKTDDGQKNIDIEVSGPHMITKKIHIDGETKIHTEMENPMFSSTEMLNEEVREKREPHHRHKQQEQQQKQQQEEYPELGLFGKGGVNLFDITGGQLTRQQQPQLQQQLEQQQSIEIIEKLQQQQRNVLQIIDQLQQQQQQQQNENIDNLLQQKQKQQWGVVSLRPWEQQEEQIVQQKIFNNLQQQQQTINIVHQLQQQQKQICDVVKLLLQQEEEKFQQQIGGVWGIKQQLKQKLQQQEQYQQQLEQEQIQQQLQQQRQDVINRQQFDIVMSGQVQPLIPGGVQPFIGRPTSGKSTILDYLVGHQTQLGRGIWGEPRGAYGTLPLQQQQQPLVF